MQKRFFLKASISAVLTFHLMTAYAELPVWTFQPLTPTQISVSDNEIGHINYLVTNQSRSPHTLIMFPIDGVIHTPTNPGDCPVLFALGNLPLNRSCNLNLTVIGSALQSDINYGPFVCQLNPLQCYQPNNPLDRLNITKSSAPPPPPPSAAFLTISLSTLALSVNDPATNAALTGKPRLIRITNTGNQTATDLAINFPTWPAGTTALSTCTSSLDAGASCTITVTPGLEPTSDCDTGIAPTPGNILVNSSNANSVSTNVVVLTYACLYQGGLIYSVDDTLPNTGSIGGKVETNTLVGVIWSSNGNGGGVGDVDYATILGIDETSTVAVPSPTAPPYPAGTPPFIPSEGNADGVTNSSNIVSYYNFNRTAGGPAPTPLSFYAAGVCKATFNGFADWYLPAICEMGYVGGVGPNSGCGTVVAPKLQNMQSSLVNYHGLSLLNGDFWSSTEGSLDPLNEAWEQSFGAGPLFQNNVDKLFPIAVLCSRNLIP
jgi:hypothetical protein